MYGPGATSTFSIPAPFAEAAASVQQALEQAGLEPVAVLDASELIHERLGVATPGCVVYSVNPQALGPEHPLAGILAVHVAVSAHGEHARVHIPGRSGEDGSEDAELRSAIHRELSAALAHVAMRRSLAFAR